MKNQFKTLLIFIFILTIGCSKDDVNPIIPTEPEEQAFICPEVSTPTNAGVTNDNHVVVWTDGIIPYAFEEDVPQEQRAIILDAMATYENIANVDYIEYSIDDLLKFPPGLLIKNSGAVQSSVYPSGMPEYISDFRVADIGWFTPSAALHELGHNLGRPHEHQLANALDYMIIDYNNIDTEWRGNYCPTEVIFLTPVELTSNMAYGAYDAAKDQSKPVITDLQGKTYEASDTLTELDKKKYLELYPF